MIQNILPHLCTDIFSKPITGWLLNLFNQLPWHQKVHFDVVLWCSKRRALPFYETWWWGFNNLCIHAKSLSWYSSNFAPFLHMLKTVTFAVLTQTGVNTNKYNNKQTAVFSALSLSSHLWKSQYVFFQCLLNQLLCWRKFVLLYWLQWDYAQCTLAESPPSCLHL